jgi:hypothetical protein
MHLDLADLAPVVLIVLISIPLFIARRRIRLLKADEIRLIEGGSKHAVSIAQEGGFDAIQRNEPLSPAARNTPEYQLARDALDTIRKQLRETRLDLAHYRKVNTRGLVLLALSFVALITMLLT